jgi:hypothetical protein
MDRLPTEGDHVMTTKDAVFNALVDRGFGEFPDGVEELIQHIDRRGDRAEFLRDLSKAFFAASYQVED